MEKGPPLQVRGVHTIYLSMKFPLKTNCHESGIPRKESAGMMNGSARRLPEEREEENSLGNAPGRESSQGKQVVPKIEGVSRVEEQVGLTTRIFSKDTQYGP